MPFFIGLFYCYPEDNDSNCLPVIPSELVSKTLAEVNTRSEVINADCGVYSNKGSANELKFLKIHIFARRQFLEIELESTNTYG